VSEEYDFYVLFEDEECALVVMGPFPTKCVAVNHEMILDSIEGINMDCFSCVLKVVKGSPAPEIAQTSDS